MSTRAPSKKRARVRSHGFVICVETAGYKASLEPRKLYEVLPDGDAGKHNQLRIVDESGDDYLYPARLFAEVELPQAVREAVLQAV